MYYGPESVAADHELDQMGRSTEPFISVDNISLRFFFLDPCFTNCWHPPSILYP